MSKAQTEQDPQRAHDDDVAFAPDAAHDEAHEQDDHGHGTWAPQKEQALRQEVGASSGAATTTATAPPAKAPADVDAVSGADGPMTTTLGGDVYVAEKGDTFASVAAKTLGNSKFGHDIAAANPKLHHHHLKAGTQIAIPTRVVSLLIALQAARHDDVATLAIVEKLSDDDWQRFLASLSQPSYDANGPVIARAEMLRSTRMTFGEMAAKERQFLDYTAGQNGQSTEEWMSGQFDRRPHLPPDATRPTWTGASADQQLAWTIMFPKVLAQVLASAPPDILKLIEGREIIWDPAATEGAYASSKSGNILVGVEWLLASNKDPTSVFSEFAHELVGHPSYSAGNSVKNQENDYLAGPIMTRVYEGLPEETRNQAGQSSAYTLTETEIYAEMVEWAYDSPASASDHPFDQDPQGNKIPNRSDQRNNDVPDLLRVVHDSYPPDLAEGIIRGFWARIVRDDRILPGAKELFRNAVQQKLGVIL